jgi:hypothetical protein
MSYIWMRYDDETFGQWDGSNTWKVDAVGQPILVFWISRPESRQCILARFVFTFS